MNTWELFPEVVSLLRQELIKKKALVGGGHDLLHDLMVAQYTLQITEDETAKMACAAALCHSLDRHNPTWTKEEIGQETFRYLASTSFTKREKGMIEGAVANHSNRPSPSDSPVLVALMDADKLANLGGLVIIRSGQFQPNLPPVNLKYLFEYPPWGNYRNPGSILRDLESCLEWESPEWMRLPKARELARPLFSQIHQFKEDVVNELTRLSLLPYPWPEDFNSPPAT